MKRHFKVFASMHGSAEEMLDAFKAKLTEFEDNVEMSTDIDSAVSIEASSQAQRYNSYKEFVLTCYPEFGIEDEDMYEEISAVGHEIRRYDEDPNHCPTYWRDDYDEPIVEVGGRYYFVAVRLPEARLTPLDSPIFGEPSEYGLPSIEACGDVFSGETCNCGDELINASYELYDTYGAPQAGEDVKYFEEWYELEEYLDENPDVQERINEGYAIIREL